MKKLSFLFIVLSISIIFGACPPLEEDSSDDILGIPMSFDEPFELDDYKWFEILDEIATNRKYVSLDLSNATCKDTNTMGGLIKDDDEQIVFDPFPASSSGKNYIVSITLPDGAKIIKQAVKDSDITDTIDDKFIEDAKKNSAFRSFTKLRSVKADNVTLIGNFAFADCTDLKEVNFPRVGHAVTKTELEDSDNLTANGYRRDIGKYAFLGCTELKEIKFNSAAVIGRYAFKDCTNMEKIDFPEVWNIERNAFEGCKNLVNVFFEKASKIGEEAFKNCTGLKKAEFNVKPDRFVSSDPSLPDDPFSTGGVILYDSVIFYSSVFNGCKALEVLNVSRAWNVYFSENVFANTGSAIEIYLFDEENNASNPPGESRGHPQNKEFLGDVVSVITLKKINLFVPVSNPKIKNGLEEYIHSCPNYSKIDVNTNKRAF